MDFEKNDRKRENIILIGMPASGKSSLGVILAKILGMDFVDTDLVIQQREKALLCDIIEKEGTDGFLLREESAVLSIRPESSVVATGGSVVYSEKAMRYLSELGKIVYLNVEKKELFRRLKNIRQRGVVLKEGESPDEMYEHRKLLYGEYADLVIDETGMTMEETVEKIVSAIIQER